jgi:hypothetical protein
MARTDKPNPRGKMNECLFDFSQYARELDAQNQFAPLDTPPGIGLRQFIDRETRKQAASSGTNTTLIAGKLYLRQLPSGLWELTHNRGRGFFDCYTGATREEMIALAESIAEEKGW